MEIMRKRLSRRHLLKKVRRKSKKPKRKKRIPIVTKRRLRR